LVWLKFLFCLVVILIAGTRLAKYGDAIAAKTGLGRIWIGLLLIAIVTSMPEMVTGISAAALVQVPDLAVGDFMGSCLFNLTILAALDMIYRPAPVLSHASRRNILPAWLGIILIILTGISLLTGERLADISLGWVGISSIVIFLFYLFFIRRMFKYERRQNTAKPPTKADNKYDHISSKVVYTRFAIAALFIIGAGIWLAFIGDEISETYNLSSSFVGSLFLAINTSLPELVVAITAVRIGAIDIAVADILGANMLNMANMFIADVFYSRGPILSSVSSDHLITALGAIVMTLLLIIALRFQGQRKTFKYISWYGVAFIAIYFAVSFFIYSSASA
jgi:cation:H+ antiporter